ncbi:hypothetical protein O9993_02875 [Vibrio lentus]|nr:hypothetical protein [Vibrio lentus]
MVEQVIHTENDDGSFSYQFIETLGEWKEKLYSGVVGVFPRQLTNGLTSAQIANNITSER